MSGPVFYTLTEIRFYICSEICLVKNLCSPTRCMLALNVVHDLSCKAADLSALMNIKNSIINKTRPCARVNLCPGGFSCCIKLDGLSNLKYCWNFLGKSAGCTWKATRYLKLKYYSGIKDCKQLLYILVKLVVFIVRGDVTWREIII